MFGKISGGADCRCFQGTPIIDASGNCSCLETPVTVNTKSGVIPQKPIAPQGYQYHWNGSAWVLSVAYDTNTQLFPQTTALPIGGQVQNFIQENKSLLLWSAIGIGAYMFLGKGKAFKSRERVETTRF